jgi:hypothetical protein
MKPEYKNDQLSGYLIGDNIRVHSHIDDPNFWFLTIRKAEIFSKRLCSKQAEPREIAKIISVEIRGKIEGLIKLVKDVEPFIYI